MPDSVVNAQITDSISQTIAAVVGNSPAETKSMLDTLMAETIGMAMYNAVTNQHNAQMVSNASMTASCARMLKTPFAIPPVVRGIIPSLETITPTPVPLPPAPALVHVKGSAFAPGMTVEIIQNGTTFAVLKGTSQIHKLSNTDFSFSNQIFSQAGSYGLFVRNQSGAASEILPFDVIALAPVIAQVTPSNGEINVTGNYFQPNLSVAIANQSGVAVTGLTVGNITPTSFSVLSSTALGPGMYSIKVINPDGNETPAFLFNIPAAG